MMSGGQLFTLGTAERGQFRCLYYKTEKKKKPRKSSAFEDRSKNTTAVEQDARKKRHPVSPPVLEMEEGKKAIFTPREKGRRK